MTLSKRKARFNSQARDKDGTFTNKNKQARYNQSDESGDSDYVPEEYSPDSSEIDEEIIETRYNIVSNIKLEWNNNADKNVKRAYIGNSTATYYRKYGPSGSFTNAAKSTSSITNYFKPINIEKVKIDDFNSNVDGNIDTYIISDNDNDDNINSVNDDGSASDEDSNDSDNSGNSDSDSETESLINLHQFDKKLQDLNQILTGNLKKISAHEYLCYRSIYAYFNYRKNCGMTCIDASMKAASEVYEKGVYKSRVIRKCASYWLNNGTLPKSLQGCHQKTKSYIDDEDVIEQSLSFIRKNGNKVTPREYKKFINKDLLSGIAHNKSISYQTARIWLHKLGLKPQSHKKGIYYDGHEREDVIRYREKFLEEMQIYEKYMPVFEGENMEQKDPILLENEKLHIFIVHDECLFYANDDRPIVWAPLGEPPLRKKGQGKSIMVSEFLIETVGRLKLSESQILQFPNLPKEARKYLRPGKNEEGWWTADHLLDQVENYAIPIFEALHPNAVGVFAFDNSTNHGAMPENGLNAKNMNVNPGGRQAIMRDTYYGPDKKFQSMVFPSNHPKYPGQAKGMRIVLQERGLWKDGLLGDCKLCKGKSKIIDNAKTDCCMRQILSLQDDFVAQKSRLQEVIEQHGHKCIFFPKYHCELNWIEMYWGAAKHYARNNCDYTWSGLQKTVPEALDSVPLITLRKYAQKSWRYMDIYRKGITGKAAEFANKKYKSHRRVPYTIYDEINN